MYILLMVIGTALAFAGGCLFSEAQFKPKMRRKLKFTLSAVLIIAGFYINLTVLSRALP